MNFLLPTLSLLLVIRIFMLKKEVLKLQHEVQRLLSKVDGL